MTDEKQKRLDEVERRTKIEMSDEGTYIEPEGENILGVCADLRSAWTKLEKANKVIVLAKKNCSDFRDHTDELYKMIVDYERDQKEIE